jgi:hypothetical protein
LPVLLLKGIVLMLLLLLLFELLQLLLQLSFSPASSLVLLLNEEEI